MRYAALDAHCLVGIFEEMLIEKGGRLAGTGMCLNTDRGSTYLKHMLTTYYDIGV